MTSKRIIKGRPYSRRLPSFAWRPMSRKTSAPPVQGEKCSLTSPFMELACQMFPGLRILGTARHRSRYRRFGLRTLPAFRTRLYPCKVFYPSLRPLFRPRLRKIEREASHLSTSRCSEHLPPIACPGSRANGKEIRPSWFDHAAFPAVMIDDRLEYTQTLGGVSMYKVNLLDHSSRF